MSATWLNPEALISPCIRGGSNVKPSSLQHTHRFTLDTPLAHTVRFTLKTRPYSHCHPPGSHWTCPYSHSPTRHAPPPSTHTVIHQIDTEDTPLPPGVAPGANGGLGSNTSTDSPATLIWTQATDGEDILVTQHTTITASFLLHTAIEGPTGGTSTTTTKWC